MKIGLESNEEMYDKKKKTLEACSQKYLPEHWRGQKSLTRRDSYKILYHKAVEILITLTNNLDIIEFLTMEYTRAQVLHVGNMFELILYFMIKMYYLLHGFTYSCNIGSSILFITSILVGLNFRRLLDIYGANVVV